MSTTFSNALSGLKANSLAIDIVSGNLANLNTTGYKDSKVSFQAPRFLAVSLIALGFNLAVLEFLVSIVGMHEVSGQAAAILAATPLNFIGNKLWSFRRLTHRTH